MAQALYRKWRPSRWETVVGQEHVISTLRNAVAADRVVHALLFAGPRGTGKTTTARLLAKALNCLDENLSNRPCDQCEFCRTVNAGRFLDLIEIDAASNTSVDDVRDLREKINFSPNQGRYKVYIIDEVHMLSQAAFNALLKTLEEPPPHAIFILATTEPHKIPATVHSRCQRHEFRRLPLNHIVERLTEMAEVEKITISPETLTFIARQATGSMRDAISLLDQLASTSEPIDLDMAQKVLGTATGQAVTDVIQALLECDPAKGLNDIHQALDSGSDVRQFARQIVEYLRNLLLVQMDNEDQVDATTETLVLMKEHATRFKVSELLGVIQNFNKVATNIHRTWQPALPLEMAFLSSIKKPAGSERDPDVGGIETQAWQSENLSSVASRKMDQALDDISPKKVAPDKQTGSAVSNPEESQAIESLIDNWQQILNLVKRKNPNTYGLLNSCKSRVIKGNVITLGFASDILKNQMSKKDNQMIVEQVLSHVLERNVSVRCIISTAKRIDIPDDVDSEGMVASALRDLGGEIVDIQ